MSCSDSAIFQSLVERSCAAWKSLNFVAEDKDECIETHSTRLRSVSCIEQLLQYDQLYWFFQIREHFMNQPELVKWDPTHLERYILLPVDYGFANNKDCFFISHYWRSRTHPDPQSEDLKSFHEDLEKTEWSYAWVDWTCMPQVPRNEAQDWYFRRMLRTIPLLVQDCAFERRFPTFEPRAWILFEVASWLLNHKISQWPTDDMVQFALHIEEMVRGDGVIPTLEKYGYRCTNSSDLRLVTGWLEVLVILHKVLPEIQDRQETLDKIYHPSVGTYWNPDLGLTVNKNDGTIVHNQIVYQFTPVFRLTS